jgi:lipoyl(octanoyl) transferase
VEGIDEKVVVRWLGQVAYEPTWRSMQAWTAARTASTVDEFWLLEHPPTYTLGLAGRREHILEPGDIPVIQIDRGGQVTYHGPGQLVVYTLIDLKRLNIGVRALVNRLEQAVIDMLADWAINAERRASMPGVYVDGAKIAAIGLKISRGNAFHGLAINVNPELAPFSGIHPCGYPDLRTTSMVSEGCDVTITEVGNRLAQCLSAQVYGSLNASP